jgi:hypothetical protein
MAPGAAASAARPLCGVGLLLAIYDDFHFKAGAIYVEEVPLSLFRVSEVALFVHDVSQV